MKQENCTDGLRNGAETGVDCGGPTCAACVDGMRCNEGQDCASHVCTGNTCAAPSCTDGVRNGAETSVDCGGPSCPACADGADCNRSEDCASHVCTSHVCAAPSCTDGVRNGAETDVDCGGGACPACAEGASCAQASDCAAPLLCRDGICAPCSEDGQCPAGSECRQGACAEDVTPPTVVFAFMPTRQVLRVRFSEPMRVDDGATGLLNPANYCVEPSDETPQECTPAAGFQGATLTSPGENAVDLLLPAVPTPGAYTVLVSNVVDRAGHTLAVPRHADFEAGGPLRVMSAASTGPHRVLLTFSQVVAPGPDAAGSAGCTSPDTCAMRYRLVGASNLGVVLSAQVRPAPYDNEVLLTHVAPQAGGNYTVIAANGVDGDGLNDAVSGPITAPGSGLALGASPLDRATFSGLGLPVQYFSDGPLQVDPFADGSAFTYVFPYREQVYLGPNRTGARAVRMDPDGFHPEDLGFRFRKDTSGTGGTRSHNSFGGTLPSIGSVGCANNTAQCGPDNEDGRGLFSSGLIGGQEWLVIGGSQSGGGLDYIYMTRDPDTTLDMKYVDLSQTLEGTTKSFSAMGVFGGRTYLGFPATSGSRKPVLVTLLRAPDASAPGLDARGNGVIGAPCDPSQHDACNLAANKMPGIGTSGTPANTASVAMIDFVSEFNGKLYLGNNGGLMRATVAQPLDYENAPQHWASIVPSAPAYAARASITTSKLTDIEPADRAWTRMAVFHGHVYLGRNTTAGPQLWRCDPATVSGPAPATAEDCDAGDWVLVAGNSAGDTLLSQFDNPHNTRLTLLAVSGEHLYVGFDNAVDGVVVYRSAAEVPSARVDFSGEGGCTADAAGCPGLGGNGFGESQANQKFNDSIAMDFEGHGYLYVSVSSGGGGPGAPARIYRHRD